MPSKPDYRYLVVKADSNFALFTKVSEVVYQMTRQKPRTETLEEIFHAAKTLDVISPFYKLDNQRLQIIQNPAGRGSPPTCRIKAFLVRQAPSMGGGGDGKKKNKYLFAIAVAFIERRLGVPVTEDGAQRIVEEMTREQGLTTDESTSLRELVDCPLNMRLAAALREYDPTVWTAF